MVLHGTVHNGVIVIDDNAPLPEGTRVIVSCALSESTTPHPAKTRIQLPLVTSAQPGSLRLTGERIAELLEESDVSS